MIDELDGSEFDLKGLSEFKTLLGVITMENTKIPAIRFKGYTEAWEQRKLSSLQLCTHEMGCKTKNIRVLDSATICLITGTDFEDGAINYRHATMSKRFVYDQDTHIQIDNGSILITRNGHAW
jgi:type I restriction enzyme S subunit